MIHTNLPIYKKGYDLLSLAADVQLNMPRTFKQSLGKRVHDECVDLLLEIGYANASRGEKRCDHIRNVLRGLEVVSLMMRRNSYHTNYPKEVAQLVQLRGAITRQINKRSKA